MPVRVGRQGKSLKRWCLGLTPRERRHQAGNDWRERMKQGRVVSLTRARVFPSPLPWWVRLWVLDAHWLSLDKQTLWLLPPLSPQTMSLRVQEKTWYRYVPELHSPQRPEFSRSWWTQVFAFLIRSPGGSKYIGLGESLYILEHEGDGLVAKTKLLNYCLYLWAWVKSDSLKSILQSLTGSKDILGFLNGLFLPHVPVYWDSPCYIIESSMYQETPQCQQTRVVDHLIFLEKSTPRFTLEKKESLE